MALHELLSNISQHSTKPSTNMAQDVKGKTAIVTGAGSGMSLEGLLNDNGLF